MWPRPPPPGLWVLDVSKAIPNQPADVNLVSQDACSARSVSVDGAGAPGAASRGLNAVGVEAEGNLSGRYAGRIGLEDAQHRTFRESDLSTRTEFLHR